MTTVPVTTTMKELLEVLRNRNLDVASEGWSRLEDTVNRYEVSDQPATARHAFARHASRHVDKSVGAQAKELDKKKAFQQFKKIVGRNILAEVLQELIKKLEKAVATPPEASVDGVPLILEMDALEEFRCPITMSLPVIPVVAEDGFVYERDAIMEWIARGNSKSPRTNVPMGACVLSASHIIRILEKLGSNDNKEVRQWRTRREHANRNVIEKDDDLQDDDVQYMRERTREEKDAELRAKAIDLDAEPQPPAKKAKL